MKAELQNIEVAYTTLKDQAQGLAFELSYMEKTLATSYNQVVPLRQEILKVRASQTSLGIQVDFSIAFHPILIFDTDVFPVKATAA
ncbi:hypothetical protein Peur_011719 [Populus x canadensis]